MLLNVSMGYESDLGSRRDSYSKLEGQRRKTSRGGDGSAETQVTKPTGPHLASLYHYVYTQRNVVTSLCSLPQCCIYFSTFNWNVIPSWRVFSEQLWFIFSCSGLTWPLHVRLKWRCAGSVLWGRHWYKVQGMTYLFKVNIYVWKIEEADRVEKDIKLWLRSEQALANPVGTLKRALPIRVSILGPKWPGFYNPVWLSHWMFVPQEGCDFGQGSSLQLRLPCRSCQLDALWDRIACNWATRLSLKGNQGTSAPCVPWALVSCCFLSKWILGSLKGKKAIIIFLFVF